MTWYDMAIVIKVEIYKEHDYYDDQSIEMILNLQETFGTLPFWV